MDRHLQNCDPEPASRSWWRILGVVAFFCLAGTVPGQSPAHRESEPAAPDVLDLIVDNAASSPALLAFDAVIKPGVDSAAELEISEPGGARFQSGQRTKQFILRRDGAESRERVRVNVADGKPRAVKVILRLLGADGKPWMVVEKQIQVNQPPPDKAAERVPVVQTLPDGTRIVDYLSRKEALARGLPAEGKPTPATPSPPAGTPQEK